jgi:ABC-2 type transport system ATP-binding protein
MRQKVLISAALLHNPAVIILDEPNSGLDVASTLVLRTLIATLRDKGRIFIYSSHVLEAVEKVCEDVIILHKGHVVASNSVAHLRAMTRSGSLEEAFTTVAIDSDVTQVGRDLAEVAAS